VHQPLARLVDRVTPYGWSNALGQKLVQLTMPGIPDVYQGTEFWDDSLVDPDNRRPVDFTARRDRLAELNAAEEPPPIDADGTVKLWLVSRTLRLRRTRPELFREYRPLWADGVASTHAVAFDRGGAISVATRLPVALERAGGWRDSTLDIGGTSTDVLTGRSFSGAVPLADLLATYPVALLAR
jgi:(1->4)-alpha-D-glucan 1-alpha-D-glucosylmutase